MIETELLVFYFSIELREIEILNTRKNEIQLKRH